MPLPYGSPGAPACVTCERIFDASTGFGNAGTVIISVPVYAFVLELGTSRVSPPVVDHVVPCSSGSKSVGKREPQMML